MILLLLLPILISGFIVCHCHKFYFYKLHRHEGQYLYIHTARLGITCLFYSVIFNALAAVIIDALRPLIMSIPALNVELTNNHIGLLASILVKADLTSPNDAPLYSWLLWVACITMFPMPHLWAYLSTLSMKVKYSTTDKRLKLYLIGEMLRDSPLDDFLFDAINKEQLVMLTMNDRKVYVGYLISMGEPNENEGPDQEITLKPRLSGYRDKDTLTVKFTTFYGDSDPELFLVLRQECIVSATLFKEELFNHFNRSALSVPVAGN